MSCPGSRFFISASISSSFNIFPFLVSQLFPCFPWFNTRFFFRLSFFDPQLASYLVSLFKTQYSFIMHSSIIVLSAFLSSGMVSSPFPYLKINQLTQQSGTISPRRNLQLKLSMPNRSLLLRIKLHAPSPLRQHRRKLRFVSRLRIQYLHLRLVRGCSLLFFRSCRCLN